MSKEVIVRINKGPAKDADFLRRLALVPFFGAEGEGEGQSSPGSEGGEGEGEEQGTPNSTPTTEPTTPDRTYSHDEVRKLIEESKSYRKRAQEAESKLSEKERAEMTELERAKSIADEAQKARDEALSELRRTRFESEVVKAAAAANFTDPYDAIALIPMGSVEVDEEGLPKTNSLSAAIKRLTDSKGYLLKTYVPQSGSGDGGSRGGTAPDRRADYAKEYQNKGMVEAPA